jgi:hypothetical protein
MVQGVKLGVATLDIFVNIQYIVFFALVWPSSKWLTCLDVSPSGRVVWAGDNKGYMASIDPRIRGGSTDATRALYRLHKTKIANAQVSPRFVFHTSQPPFLCLLTHLFHSRTSTTYFFPGQCYAFSQKTALFFIHRIFLNTTPRSPHFGLKRLPSARLTLHSTKLYTKFKIFRKKFFFWY